MNEWTRVKTAGISRSHSSIESNETIPSNTGIPSDLKIVRGPPLSPEKIK